MVAEVLQEAALRHQEDSVSWDEPATGWQKAAITRLCIAAGVREELEQRQMTRLEARNTMHELRRELENRNRARRRDVDHQR